MALRNTNVRATSLLKHKKNEEEISRKNLILGKKMQAIFSRKKSHYGETETVSMKEGQLSEGYIKNLRMNQSSQDNIDNYLNDKYIDD